MKHAIEKTLGYGKGLVVLFLGLGLGYLLWARGDSSPPGQPDVAEERPAAQKWTCSMHPHIQKDGPGECPLCGMDLIPVDRPGGPETGPSRELVVSPAERELMRIRTVPVERRFVETEVRMVGKIGYDETRLAYITAWVPGRIDRLYVDYTGVTVQKGDHMVYLYSPDLYSAQEELLQAKKAVVQLERSDIAALRDTAQATVEASRDKLRFLGLTTEQVAEIEERGRPTEHMTIFAPAGGLVIHKAAQEGMYVETGTHIFTIADLSRVWVLLDAYETDLTWLRFGQKVTFETEAFPGEAFSGTISFIDPVLDPVTRTITIRVIADNSKRVLKPDMFVRARVLARVANHGKVMDPSLLGKWVSPMHPEIVKDEPGDCDVCGMPLVPAETLGYLSENEVESKKPLVIPVSAALRTGTRAVVYVELPGREEPAFEGREVVLGPRAGDYYIVRSGLREGELVVSEGNFKIDSALQIQAKPSMMSPASMMSPEGGPTGGAHSHHGGHESGAEQPPLRDQSEHSPESGPGLAPVEESSLGQANFELPRGDGLTGRSSAEAEHGAVAEHRSGRDVE